MDLSLILESDWSRNLPKMIKGKKIKETKVIQEQKYLSLATAPKDVVRRLHTCNRNILKAVSSLKESGRGVTFGASTEPGTVTYS